MAVSHAPSSAHGRMAPLLAGAYNAKIRPLVIRMVIACVTVAIALMIMVPSVSNAADMVNLNKANLETLQTLPNIGEKRAKAIISYRKKNGSFKDKKDLLNVPGIGEKILSKISRKVSVSGGGLSLGSSSKDSKKSTKTKSSKTSTSKKSTSKSSSDSSSSKDKKSTKSKSKSKSKDSKTDSKKSKKSSSKTKSKKKSGSSSKKKKKSSS